MKRLVEELEKFKLKFDFNVDLMDDESIIINFNFNNDNKSKFILELEKEDDSYLICLDEYDIFIRGVEDFSFYLDDELEYSLKDIFKILNFIYDIDNKFLKDIDKGMDGKRFSIDDNIFINVNIDRYKN